MPKANLEIDSTAVDHDATATQSATDNELQNEVNQFCQNFSKDAFWLVLNEFPVKIKEMEALKAEFSWDKIVRLRSDSEWVKLFTRSYLADRKSKRDNSGNDNEQSSTAEKKTHKTKCIQDNSMKPFLFEAYADYNESKSAMIETNQAVHSMIRRVQPYVFELIDHTLRLSFAIEILEPKLQEGNNFGVEVQCKVFNDVVDIYNRVDAFSDKLNSYYQRRQQAIQAMLTNPQIEDYQISLGELDFSYLYSVCRGVEQLYSSYTEIHDYVVKNIDKLLQPRDDEDNVNA